MASVGRIEATALRVRSEDIPSMREALLHITQARAFAAVGERTSAAHALIASHNALTRDEGSQPSYSAVSGPALGTVTSHTARTLTELGDHVGTEKEHRAALIRWDPEKFRRVHMLTYADLGDSLAAQTRADEAIAVWSHAIASPGAPAGV